MIEVSIDCSKSSSIALECPKGLFCLESLDIGRSSDSEFLPRLQAFLKEHDITINDVEGWTIGIGPGSFAGIRFSLALGKGICTVTGAKARGIPSSYAIAKSLNMDGTLCVLQNARCGKVFVSCYDSSNGRCLPSKTPSMMEPNDITSSYNAYCTPDPELGEILPLQIADSLQILPPANARFLLGAPSEDWNWLDTPDVEPIYVRPPA